MTISQLPEELGALQAKHNLILWSMIIYRTFLTKSFRQPNEVELFRQELDPYVVIELKSKKVIHYYIRVYV